MTEYANGLYIIGRRCKNADIWEDGFISTGYGDGDKPYFDVCIRNFYTRKSSAWQTNSDDIEIYFTNPELIAPINLIKWED